MIAAIPDGYYEHINLTVHYPCNHTMMRTVRRDSATQRQNAGHDRIVYSAQENCPNCRAMVRSKWLTKMERF